MQSIHDTIIIPAGRSIQDTVILVDDDSGINAETARRDIRNQQPRLLLVGGIAPIVHVCEDQTGKRILCPNPARESYGIEYIEFGCTPPPKEHLRAYQEVVFNWLDDTYGKDWREVVRPDVKFLQEKL